MAHAVAVVPGDGTRKLDVDLVGKVVGGRNGEGGALPAADAGTAAQVVSCVRVHDDGP